MSKLKAELGIDEFKALKRMAKADHFMGLPLLEMCQAELLVVIAYERRAAQSPPAEEVDDE